MSFQVVVWVIPSQVVLDLGGGSQRRSGVVALSVGGHGDLVAFVGHRDLMGYVSTNSVGDGDGSICVCDQ